MEEEKYSMLTMKRIGWVALLAACCLGFRTRLAVAGEGDAKLDMQLAFGANTWTFTTSGGRTLLDYRPVASPMKPYVQRLYTPGGVQILRDSPSDHKHHHGLMFALGVDGVDFWGEEKGAGKEWPLDDHAKGSGSFMDGDWSSFAQIVSWTDTHGKTLVVEKRTVGVVAPHGPKPVTMVTWSSELSPDESLASVQLDGHHYYGLGMRFVESMDSGGRFFNSSGKPGEIVRGSERLVPAKWEQ